MNPHDQKILACVDRSRFADGVADAATWAAQRLAAPLELLHVIDRHPAPGAEQDHSGAIGLGAQDTLLTELSDQDAQRTRAEREAGRVFLNRLRERALAHGAYAVDVRQRHGDIEETLAEQQAEVRLFVLGRRGTSAEATQRALGHKLEWVVRSVQRPVLAVAETFVAPRSVLFAFDGSSVTRRGVDMIAASPLLQGLPVHLLMAGSHKAQSTRQLEEARSTLTTAGYDVTVELPDGDPIPAVRHTLETQGHNLLVMGAYSHSPWRSLLVGSKTRHLLQAVQVSTLLLR